MGLFLSSAAAAAKQTIQVVLCHRPVCAAVLKQESCHCRTHQLVLVPLGVLLEEITHALEQLLRHLRFHAHHLYALAFGQIRSRFTPR